MISLALLVAYCAVFFLSISQPILFIQFVVGVVTGFFVVYVDRILHAFFLSPEEEFNQLIQEQWRKRSFSGLIRLLYHAEGMQQGLLTRSVLFLAAYIILTVFVLTSTGSILGGSLILGMGLRYSFDMFNLMKTPEVFIKQFLSQVNHQFSRSDVRSITLGWVLGFIIVSALAWM